MKTRHVLKSVLVACAAVYGALPSSAQATPFTPSLLSVAAAYFAYPSNGKALLPEACSNLSLNGTTETCNGSTPSPEFATTNATLNYSSTATAAYGVLKAAGSSYITGANGTSDTTYYSESQGEASFQDAWTITGGTGTGTLTLQFAVDGTIVSCAPGDGWSFNMDLYNYSNSSSSISNFSPPFPDCPAIASQTLTLTTGFTFGTPIDFTVGMQAGSELYNLGTNISSSSDFSNTATMSAISVTDANGNTIPFDLTTASGASLFSQLAPSVPTSSVPEPSSLALLGAGLIGLLGLGAMRRRKKQAA